MRWLLAICSKSAGTPFWSMTTKYSAGPFVSYRWLSLELVDYGGSKQAHLGRRCYAFIRKNWPIEEKNKNCKHMPSRNRKTTGKECRMFQRRNQPVHAYTNGLSTTSRAGSDCTMRQVTGRRIIAPNGE